MTAVLNRHDRRDQLAIHEASHAVVAVSLGLPVRSVSIIATTTGQGHTKLWKTIGAYEPCRLATFAFAGAEGEWRLNSSALDVGQAADDAFARELLDLTRRPDGASVDLLEERCRTLARGLLTCHWQWTERVALALLKRKILTGDDVLSLREADDD